MPNYNKKLDFNPKFLMQSQRGYDCKIIVIGAVLNYLHKKNKIKTPPLPARFRSVPRKNKQPEKISSLRQLAKQISVSEVPEAIDNPAILAKIARAHPEVAADYAHCPEEADYINNLIFALNNGLAPIVFFDVNTSTRQPRLAKGECEHAAVVIGWQVQGGRVKLTLAQWRGETLVDGTELFNSSNQLRQERKGEEYYKYPERVDGCGRGWIPKPDIDKYGYLKDSFPEDAGQQYEQRTGPDTGISTNNGGLRAKILLIGSQDQSELIQSLKSGSSMGKTETKAKPSLSVFSLLGWGCFWLITLACLYGIGHSLAVVILHSAVWGMAVSLAPCILATGALFLFIELMVLLSISNKSNINIINTTYLPLSSGDLSPNNLTPHRQQTLPGLGVNVRLVKFQRPRELLHEGGPIKWHLGYWRNFPVPWRVAVLHEPDRVI